MFTSAYLKVMVNLPIIHDIAVLTLVTIPNDEQRFMGIQFLTVKRCSNILGDCKIIGRQAVTKIQFFPIFSIF